MRKGLIALQMLRFLRKLVLCARYKPHADSLSQVVSNGTGNGLL